MMMGAATAVMMMTMVGCSSTVKNDTIENAYMSLYDCLMKEDFAQLEKLQMMTEADKQQIHYNFAGLNLENIEITNVKELYSEGPYVLYIINSLQDYDVVKDKPMMEAVVAKKTENGFQFLAQDYILNSSTDEQLHNFYLQVQQNLNNFQQTQEYIDFTNQVNNHAMQHQQELEQWSQQIMETQMNESQRAANNAMIEAQNAANQAMNNNAPMTPPMP